MSLKQFKSDIKQQINLPRAKFLQRFFKTGRGGYAERDKFLGLTVPQSRILVRKYFGLQISEIKKLLQSKFHEERLIALLILVDKFKKVSDKEKDQIFKFYLDSTKYINNWDLVDSSADKIVGGYLLDPPSLKLRLASKNTPVLSKLAKSKDIWERRIAMIATFQFIKNHRFDKTIEIAKILLKDKHDLIHKAIGWMLREIGKRDEKALIKFLDQYYKIMPRTALRYAIEKLGRKQKLYYIKK